MREETASGGRRKTDVDLPGTTKPYDTRIHTYLPHILQLNRRIEDTEMEPRESLGTPVCLGTNPKLSQSLRLSRHYVL